MRSINARPTEIEAALGASVTAGLNKDLMVWCVCWLLAHQVEKTARWHLTVQNRQRSANALDSVEEVRIARHKIEAYTGAGGSRRCDRQTIQKCACLKSAAVKILKRIFIDAALFGNHTRRVS